MTLIAIAGDKGSPGVTTTAVSLAAVWPRRMVLAEFDPFGGDIAFRLRGPRGVPLSPETGVLSLALAVRRGASPEQIYEHVQRLDGGLEVLLGLASGEQAAGMVNLWAPMADLLSRVQELDVIADCGRLFAGAPTVDTCKKASAVVLVARPTIDSVAHLRARATNLAAALGTGASGGVPIYVVVVTGSRDDKSPREIQTVLAQAEVPAQVIGRIAYDPQGAGMLTGEWVGRLDRSLLIRSAREVAGRLAHELAQRSGVPAGSER